MIALRFARGRVRQRRGPAGAPRRGGSPRCIARAAGGGYEVRDPESRAPARPSRAGDVHGAGAAADAGALRWRTRSTRAGLRFAVDGGKSFFDRQEVHETLAMLRAIDDPADRVSLVAALRSSFFGVSDRDMVALRTSRRRGWLAFGPTREPAGRRERSRSRCALLQELHDERRRVSVPALLERLYDRTRVLAGAHRHAPRRGADREPGEGGGARAPGRRARACSRCAASRACWRTRMSSRREEPDLPATRPGDPDTVRVLSIHKAKGLEAPIVVLYDPDARLRRSPT